MVLSSNNITFDFNPKIDSQKDLEKIDEFSNLHNKEGWKKFHNYPQAFSFTKYLVDKFGKEKILSFLINLRKSIGSNNSYDEFVKYFNKFLKTNFSQEVSFWLKLERK